ncbi:MAG: GntR family transcriptional regulator [Planctomycetota bacterium]
MQIQISDDGVPLYQQIVEQIRHRILSQQLARGDELPAIRSLAQSLRVNPNTIARAYRELELAGLVEKRRTRGTFVTGAAPSLSQSRRKAMVVPSLDQLIQLAHGLNVSDEELSQWLTERICHLSKKEATS